MCIDFTKRRDYPTPYSATEKAREKHTGTISGRLYMYIVYTSIYVCSKHVVVRTVGNVCMLMRGGVA